MLRTENDKEESRMQAQQNLSELQFVNLHVVDKNYHELHSQLKYVMYRKIGESQNLLMLSSEQQLQTHDDHPDIRTGLWNHQHADFRHFLAQQRDRQIAAE